MKYEIIKHFTKGILKGITITEQTNIKFTENKQYSEYKILSVKEL